MVVPSPHQRHFNPVHAAYFADPFVWQHQGVYYAIGTGELEAMGRTVGNIFPILRSRDFFRWEFVTHALTPPDPALGDTLWAPEVAYANDAFYLYYSVGHSDKEHRLRVALSDSPSGPYRDLGQDLVSEVFAIDPHPFRDDDGQWYLFYARDFLERSDVARAGTALVAARLHTMTELESDGFEILRARSDWQRFQAARPMYGRVWDWHTLEGPCVRKHRGRYYCFYSGGRWENETYGVDYGVADRVLGPYSDAGNEAGPRVLRAIPGQLTGPGHNSVVVGPDARTNYLVYHAWDKEMKARQMFIDPLLWTAEGPRAGCLMGIDGLSQIPTRSLCQGSGFTPLLLSGAASTVVCGIMKLKNLMLAGFLAAPLAGCSSYQGATTDQYGTASDRGQVYPTPIASPTFRPGMNPDDPRDAHFTTRPQPQASPPTTNP